MNAADALGVLPFAAFAVCGLLVVLLQPSNRAAQLLLAVGLLFPLSRWLEEVPDSAAGQLADLAVVSWVRDASFLIGLACLVAALSRFPDGAHQVRAEVLTERVVGAAAVLAVVGLPIPGAISQVAGTLAATEPAWALAGIGTLMLRYRRSSAAARQHLRWPLRALTSLALLLMIAVSWPGEPDWTGPAFMVALASFPLSLAAGVAARARRIESDLVLSRARLVTAEDQARRRLERDLHDGAQQQLVGLLSLAQLAQRQQERGDAGAGATLQQVVHETQRAMTDLRELASGIHPSVLTDCGLVDAVDSRLSLLPVSASLSDQTAGRRWPPAIEAAAYYVVCEALTNAMKHARCQSVLVDVTDRDGRLQVSVQDDGCGFSPSSTPLRGLTGVRDRVEALGGTVELRSRSTGGTRLRAVFGPAPA